jgi:hypothetical protein
MDGVQEIGLASSVFPANSVYPGVKINPFIQVVLKLENRYIPDPEHDLQDKFLAELKFDQKQ